MSGSAAVGTHDIVIAGGMESMSNTPYYLPKARSGYRSGHGTLVDGMIHDGLWDPHVDQHMGECAELCAKRYGITRVQQDDHALESFRRATEAAMSGATGMVQTIMALPGRLFASMCRCEEPMGGRGWEGQGNAWRGGQEGGGGC